MKLLGHGGLIRSTQTQLRRAADAMFQLSGTWKDVSGYADELRVNDYGKLVQLQGRIEKTRMELKTLQSELDSFHSDAENHASGRSW